MSFKNHLRVLTGATVFMALGTALPSWAMTAQAMTAQAAGAIHIQMHTSSAPTLEGTAFANPTTGWLVGKGIILKSTDGGNHFSVQARGSFDVAHLDVMNASVVIAYGDHDMMATTNGGQSWRRVAVPGPTTESQASILQVSFVSRQVGYVTLGQRGVGDAQLYRTKDGGLHWSKVAGPQHTVSVGFATASLGWAITSSSQSSGGGFYRTINGGRTWTETQREPASDWYVQGAYIQPTGGNSAIAQVIGQAGMSQSSSSVFSTDNGMTWKPVVGVSTAGGGPAPGITQGMKVAVGPGYDAGSMVVVGKDSVFLTGGMAATGMGTVALSTSANGGRTWQSLGTLAGVNGYFPAGPGALSFVDHHDGWLLTSSFHHQTLLRTTDGGHDWHAVYPTPTDWPVMGVDFVSRKVGYGLGAAGNVNQVVITADGGHHWRPLAQLPVHANQAYIGPSLGHPIQFINRRVGVTIGGDGNLYVTTNGGHSWVRKVTPTKDGRVMQVWVGSTIQTMVTEMQNGVYRTHDGGRRWVSSDTKNLDLGSVFSAVVNQVDGGTFTHGLGLFGANEWPTFFGRRGNMVWMTSGNGQGYMRSVDGGSTFHAYDYPKTNFYPMTGSMGFVSQQDGWLWTMDDDLFTTTNGGRSWSEVE